MLTQRPALLCLLMACAPLSTFAAGNDLAPVFHKQSPASLDDLKAIEKQVKAVLPRISRAVVCVQVGGASGSGVVISPDGLVLTAAHVCGATNRDVMFTFPDGSTARGKTLGLNSDMDAGMMKISTTGPWPCVDQGDLDQVHLGDWVLTLGHPGGFDADRSVVVRLGRIIRLSPEMVQTDCTLNAGDSGGPLFNMQGKVIGIHSRISDSTAENYHVPITAYSAGWDRLVKSDAWGGQRFASRPWFGVRGTDDSSGCRLLSIEQGAPASKAGLKIGDIVRKINSRIVADYDSLKQIIAAARPGDELKVELQRDDKDMVITVKIEANPRRR